MKAQQQGNLVKGLESAFLPQATGDCGQPEQQLRAEREAMQKALKQLEEELALAKAQLARSQEECDAYRKLAYAWAREKLPSDVTIDQGQDWQPLEAFLPDLERSLRGT